MTAVAKTTIAAVVLVALAIAMYPNARRIYVRHRTESHLEDAQELRAKLTSPVAAQSLESAISTARLTLRGDGADTDTIQKADAALMDVMKRIAASPPPDHPVSIDARYESSVRAGATFPIAVTIRSQLPEIFVVAAVAELDSGAGWKSGPVRSPINQVMRSDSPLDARINVPIPPTMDGKLSVAVSVFYRLNVTGEGQDLRERPRSALPLVTIAR